ncbi:MAG: hypothetical protein A2341_23460 [Deltaproteobacteria bacterium RIFOXYB12_FULL_58_9]|nr:MAG: hypothetical protein A2341_23460 [Deltaproteobacteria bacterium RIFOXYB12_FULL_58_9]
MKYQAVILAAGRGSRLSEKTGEMPKALLPIGPRTLSDQTQTTFLRRQIEVLADLGVDDIVVVVGYLRKQIIADFAKWDSPATLVVNPTPQIETSGSLHSFQFAVRSDNNVLDGSKQTLLLDADIVYHRDVLARLIDAPEQTTILVCSRTVNDNEEVLVYGTVEQPRYLGKGLTPRLVGGVPCLGEATGIVKIAPRDHLLAREITDWMLGDPTAPEGTLPFKGFGPARRATEHEELTGRLMLLGKMTSLCFDDLPFMEVDSAAEYATLRSVFYPQLLKMEKPE